MTVKALTEHSEQFPDNMRFWGFKRYAMSLATSDPKYLDTSSSTY